MVEATLSADSFPLVHVFKISASRTLTGMVTAYDVPSGRYVPVAGAMLSLPKLDKQAKTNAKGEYIFPALPPETLELSLQTGGVAFRQTIFVPAHPVVLRDDFRVSTLRKTVIASLAVAAQ